jgi:hypothetical protein
VTDAYEHSNERRYHEGWRISRIIMCLSVSQEGLCSMKLTGSMGVNHNKLHSFLIEFVVIRNSSF